MRDYTFEGTLTPTKYGRVNGKFTPSPLGNIKIKKSGGQIRLKMNRAERRRLK